jgi:hypothetical protein
VRICVIKKQLGGIVICPMITTILYRKFHEKRKTFTHIPTRTKTHLRASHIQNTHMCEITTINILMKISVQLTIRYTNNI